MRYKKARQEMLDVHLQGRGIRDPRVLDAMSKVPREAFVPEGLRERAYADFPLPIGQDQTISQPYMVALMSSLLELVGTERVLEVGVGSGYQTAVLAHLAAWVYGIERVPQLFKDARSRLEAQSFHNVALKRGDGTLGWREMAPFDAILVAAAAPSIPKPLTDQLSDGGRLILPIGTETTQTLLRIRRDGDQLLQEEMVGCRFVPLIGRFGFPKRPRAPKA